MAAATCPITWAASRGTMSRKAATRVSMSRSPAEYLRMLNYDSCVHEIEVLEALVRRVGADRVVLGSDYPAGEGEPIAFVRSCALSEDEKRMIIGENAGRLFGVAPMPE